VGRGLSPGHVLHPFLLALYTNLATDVAKLGACAARIQGGGDTGGCTDCTPSNEKPMGISRLTIVNKRPFGCKSAPYHICSIRAPFSVVRFVISGGYYHGPFEYVIELIVR